MTSEDCELDVEVVQGSPLILYRLARKRYSNLSGVGAALYPGRWNRTGQEAIYTSTEMGVPLLERLVHTPKSLIPSNLAMMKVRVEGNWQRSGDAMFDPGTGGTFFFWKSLQQAKEMFPVGLRDSFAVAVPSVIVPVWNVVLYPEGIGFWQHVKLESVEDFEFDPRLFPPEAAVEASISPHLPPQ